MKKKENPVEQFGVEKKPVKSNLQIDSYRGDSSVLYKSHHTDDESILINILSKSFEEEEIENLNKEFDKFFKLLFENSVDDATGNLLIQYKNELRSRYLLDIKREFDKECNIYGNSKDGRQPALVMAKGKIFFYADLVIAFVMGNEENLRIMKTELEELRNIRREYPKKFLEKMKEIETTKQPKPSQFQCVIEANRVFQEYEESDLIDIATGEPTQKAVNIINSYKSQKKFL